MASHDRAVLKQRLRARAGPCGKSAQAETVSAIVPAHSPFFRVEVGEGDDAGRDTLLMAVELADLDFRAGRRMGHIHAAERDHLAEDR